VAVPSDRGTPLDKCSGELEPSGRLLEQLDCPTQEWQSVGPRRDRTVRSAGYSLDSEH